MILDGYLMNKDETRLTMCPKIDKLYKKNLYEVKKVNEKETITLLLFVLFVTGH